ncbi:MAG: cytochrome b/b6 domain-containing protein [Fibrobacteria bacterium]|nr:cytochrome b/b6 domain-containing protein [Fibrobacteria bacterium]
MKKSVYIYKGFERFWHWSQAFLIMFLAFTGFEIHSSYHFFGFEKAVMYHRVAAYLLMGLIAFAVFWHFTTGEWRHYIPTLHNLKSQLAFYLKGIFQGGEHPFQKNIKRKLNPLQIITYLGFKLFLIPITVLSGVYYLFYKNLDGSLFPFLVDIGIEPIALLHTMGAFFLLSFLVVHVYMTTTGLRPTSNIRAMITGYEDLEEEQ